MTPHTRGTLFLVVGPSGAGKDSLIDGAKAALEADPRYVFARRVITRPQDSGGEDHMAVTEDAFDSLIEDNALLLHWRAHGLSYGVPAELGAQLDRGRHVIVNVSRTVIDEARRTLQPVVVLSVTVSDSVLHARLSQRGRESVEDIAKRVERARAYTVTGDDVREIDNGGKLTDSIQNFLRTVALHAKRT